MHCVLVGTHIIPGSRAECVGADTGKAMWCWGGGGQLKFSSDRFNISSEVGIEVVN